MRWGGLITFAIIIAAGVALSFLITDDWIESQVESTASRINGAKVEIDDFRFSVIGLSMGWNRLQVTNPESTMENIVETGESKFDVDLLPLIYGSVVIESFKVTGVKTNTPRETDGYMEFPEEKEEAEPGYISELAGKMTRRISETAGMKISSIKSDINVDSVLSMVDIRTPDKIDSLKNNLQQKYERWDGNLDTLNVDDRVNTIKSQAESIEPKKIKDPKKLKKTIETVQQLQQNVKSLKSSFKTTRENLQNDLKEAGSVSKQVEGWVADDFSRARSAARLPEISAQNIGQMLFGETIVNRLSTYLGYVATARKYATAGSDSEKKDRPPRYEGRDIHFSDKYTWPGFWIKNLDVSGTTGSGLNLSGKVEHITSNQQMIGEVTSVDLAGSGKGGVSLTLKGTLDYLSEEPEESFEAEYSGFPLKDVRLSSSSLLPYELRTGTGNLKASLNLKARSMDSDIDFTANGLQFGFSETESEGEVEKMIQSIAKNMDRLTIGAGITSREKDLDISITSNLNDLFLKNIKDTISREVRQARQKIESEITGRIDEKKSELTSLVDEREKELRNKLSGMENRINSELRIVEEKREELEKRKKELLKGGVRDLIDF